MVANFAYRALVYQGFTKDSIYYLSADTELDLDNNGQADDVDAEPTTGESEICPHRMGERHRESHLLSDRSWWLGKVSTE
jgi:hypothetical protein